MLRNDIDDVVTRRYPRTLNEAFPQSVEAAQWFYPPPRNNTLSNTLMYLVAICLWVCLAYILVTD